MNTNQKLLAGLLLSSITITGVTLASSTTGTASSTENTVKERRVLTDEQKAQMEVLKTILEKKKEGKTLTSEEQAILDTFQVKRSQGKMGEKGGQYRGKGIGKGFCPGIGMGEGRGMAELTDTEKTALESMTNIEKQAFFEAKRTEQELKREKHEAVIDKLLNGETLTDADKVIVEEIKLQRAEMKVKKAQMEEMRTLMKKVKNGETLTADEQAKVDSFKAQIPQKGEGKGFGKGIKMTQ